MAERSARPESPPLEAAQDAFAYAGRLLRQGSAITRFAHRSRFRRSIELLGARRYRRALDFGCGDGLLLHRAYQLGSLEAGVGVETAPERVAACEQRFAGVPQFSFCTPEDLDRHVAPRSCDLAICTETLEHVASAGAVLDRILACCAAGARLVVSVPIEVGPALLLKQVGRYLANLAAPYGYERYRVRELLSAALLRDASAFPSSHRGERPLRGHKGFDYRAVEALLRERTCIERTVLSPFPRLGPSLNSSIFWVCRVAPARRGA